MRAEQQYIDLFTRYEDLVCRHSAAVMNAPRAEALADFDRLGFPSVKSEDYKYTDVAQAFAPDYGVNINRLAIPVNPYDVFRCDVPNLSTSLYFVINDTFYDKMMPKAHLPEGVYAGGLKAFAEKYPEVAARYYGKAAKSSHDGDGRWRRRLTAMRARLDLVEAVDMPGFMPHDQTRAFMRDHDILIVPSVVHSNGDRDGIPNVIMEALSQCMPVIATDVCGIAEVIRHNETGLLVAERDPRALALAVRHMLADRERARRMAEAGRDLVERMFDRTRNITALRDLYLSEYRRFRAERPQGAEGNA